MRLKGVGVRSHGVVRGWVYLYGLGGLGVRGHEV